MSSDCSQQGSDWDWPVGEGGAVLLGTGHLTHPWPPSRDMQANQHLIGHGRGCGVVAGWRMGVLVASWTWCHLVVALGTRAGLVGALWRGGSIGGKLVCVVPAETKSKGTICSGQKRGSGGIGESLGRGKLGLTQWTHMAGVPGVCGLYCGLTCGDEGSG